MNTAPKLPTTEPALIGAMGKAWRYERGRDPRGEPRQVRQRAAARADGRRPGRLRALRAPAIMCISLREVPGFPPAHINMHGATHEIMVYALNPEHAIDLASSPRFLTPCNFVGQFIQPSDDEAAALIEQTVRDVIDGRLNPDTDYAQWWIQRFSASNVTRGIDWRPAREIA